MSTMAERIPLDDIAAEAERMRKGTGPALLSLLALPFYLLGMLVFWLVVGTLKGAYWIAATIKMGYTDARERASARGVTTPVWSAKTTTEDRDDLGSE